MSTVDSNVRRILADHILNPAHSPMSCLGAAVSALRVQGGPAEKRVADAVEMAILSETEKLKAAGK